MLKKLALFIVVFCFILGAGLLLYSPGENLSQIELTSVNGESIPGFGAEIRILKNGDLLVTETIQVISNGAAIKRGITRAKQTHFENQLGELQTAEYSLNLAFRNNERINFHEEDIEQGVKFYFGDQDVLLEPGEYTYSIQYTVRNKVEYLEDRDVLRLEVTGPWPITIQSAVAIIKLPKLILPESVTIVGRLGGPSNGVGNSTKLIDDDDIEIRRDLEENTIYATSKSLIPAGKSFFIEMEWPKGFVEGSKILEEKK